MKTALIALMFLTGCASQTANMIEERGGSEYGPTNEAAGGRVQYLLNGNGEDVRARREDAYRQMHARCGGSYKITDEQDVAAGSVTRGGAIALTRGMAVGASNSATAFIHLVSFECGGEKLAKRDSVLARIGLEIECSAENVSIERVYALRPGITGYDVTAFGDRYACTEDYGGMACQKTWPTAARE